MTERDQELELINQKVLERIQEMTQEADEYNESVDGFMCPVDPMERLQCESCQ